MELISQNIYLREYQKLDWKRVHLYAAIEDFAKYDAWGPNSDSDTITFIDEMIKHQSHSPRKNFEFAVISNSEKVLIGGCGLRKAGEKSSIGMIGYAVNPSYQGRGVATEAMKLLLKLGFEQLNLSVIYATCDIENISSYKVMEKSGLTRVGEVKAARTFKNRVSDEYRYEITKEQFFTSNPKLL